MDAETRAQRFLERLADYDVGVIVVEQDTEVGPAVLARLRACEVERIAAPADLPAAWRPEGVQIICERDLDADALDRTPAVLTGCALAIAETGSVALDGGARQGRRALTLLPDHHICVVRCDQLVETVPQALQALKAAVADERRPLTLFSGPSATADIEFDRVVGVHGPRRLDVVFVSSR